jgi:hypothetical protein
MQRPSRNGNNVFEHARNLHAYPIVTAKHLKICGAQGALSHANYFVKLARHHSCGRLTSHNFGS